jgi:hypothetical protein
VFEAKQLYRVVVNWRAAGALAGLLGLVGPLAAAEHDARQFVDENCGKCHNATDWAGGVAFDTLPVDDPAKDAEEWEKAVRKVRGGLMPPPGEKQPAPEAMASFVSWMEGKLDAAAAGHADPGTVVLHRLNRTEYSRAIEGLLGVKVDAKTILPRDVSSDGFDNVAATLQISPSFLEQYIAAARNVARQAVGRTEVKASSRAYRQPGNDQRNYVNGLPLGTRGGMLVEHYFPADGEYVFYIRDFHFSGAGYINRIDTPHRVVMTIDDERVFEQTVGGPDDLKSVDQTFSVGEGKLQARFNNIRLNVKAGTHRVGVAFVQRSFAESDSPLQPIAMLPEMERFPEIPGLEISGPFKVTGLSETVSRRRIFICQPKTAAEEPACARRIIANLAEQAYRRPVSDQDLEAPLKFYAESAATGGFERGIESAITAVLSSTHFLFRATPPPPGAKPGEAFRIDDLALASRLSFFLWSQGPDDELRKLAAAGRLRDPAELNRQVDRLLADPRADSVVTNFAFQWLNFGRMDNIIPDPLLYPDFDRDLRDGYREELRLFVDSILRADRSVLELLSANYSFLNERVALQYGIKDIRGPRFRKVELADANRWGLLGKGGLLMATAYGNRTSPVLRGAWILETLSGTPPTAPPPGVETLQEAVPGTKTPTVRERLEAHRAAPSCNSCHGIIDPLGFALENYDVAGAWRDKDLDAGTVIDARGQLADGRSFSTPAQLRAALLTRPDQFVQALTEKLMVFALGRAVEYHDMPVIRGIVRSAAPNQYRFADLVKGVVQSPAFQQQRVPAQPLPAPRQAMNVAAP